jgi:hypothetical protein
VALAWQWFLRLAGQGKDVNTFLVTFCRLLVRAVKAGRRVCGMHRSKDVLNPLAQQRFGFRVERLPASTRRSHDSLCSPAHGQKQVDAFEERLRDNSVTPVVEQVVFRLDWPRFFRTLSRRDRSLAAFLSEGNTNKLASRKFKLSPARVTQLRQQWCRQWRVFQGDVSAQPIRPPSPS